MEKFNWQLNYLMDRYLESTIPFRVHDIIDGRLYWLMSQADDNLREAVADALSIVAEQYAAQNQDGVAILVSANLMDAQALHKAYLQMKAYTPSSSRDVFVHFLDPEKKEDSQYSSRVLLRVSQYIENNLSGDLSLTTLSKVAGYNASYLSRLFMEKTGETLSNHIAKCKMERINQLMRDETLSSNDIAELTGFETRSYFNRFVKRITGFSPLQLRKKIHQDADVPIN